MNSSFVASISHATNLAATHLANGQRDQAASLLQKVLFALKNRVPEEDKPSPRESGRSIIAHAVDCVPGFGPQSTRAVADSTFEFSDRFFLLPSSCDDQSPEDLSLLSFLVLYNMGTIRHQIGLCTGRSSELIKAIRMYAFAVSTVETLPLGAISTVRVLCSLYNNMGHAYEQLGAFQYSQACMERLLNILHATQQSPHCDQMLTADDCDFYYQYFGMGPGKTFCAAPTA